MTLTVTHTTAADGTFSAAGAAAWNAGHTISGSTEIVYAASPNSDFDLTNGGAGGAVTILNRSIAGIAVGDQILVNIWYSILNDSAASRAYAPTCTLGSFGVLSAGTTGNVLASPTSRTPFHAQFSIAVSAANLTYGSFSQIGGLAAFASGTVGNLGTTASIQAWSSTTGDVTGTNTFSFALASNSTTTTQTLTLQNVDIRKISAT